MAKGILAIWGDCRPEREHAFNTWYERQHLAERTALPGFRHGMRYRALAGRPRCLTVYEVDEPAVLRSPAYLACLENPTDWTRRVRSGWNRRGRRWLAKHKSGFRFL